MRGNRQALGDRPVKLKPPHHGWHHLDYRDPGELGKMHPCIPRVSSKAQKVPASLHPLFLILPSYFYTGSDDPGKKVDLFACLTRGL